MTLKQKMEMRILYNGLGSKKIIMSQKNKTFLINRLNDIDKYRSSPMLGQLISRIVPASGDGASLMAEMRKIPDSCVVVDMVFGDEDAVSFIKEARRNPDLLKVDFVVICEFLSFRLERELYGAGAACVVSRDIAPESIWNMMFFPSGDKKQVGVSGFRSGADYPADSVELEIMVTDILHKIGVPAHIKGYKYLRCAIVKTVVRPDIIGAVTKELYPGVAECFDTTPSRVERAIRHAIEVAWDRGDIDFLNAYFGSTIHTSRGKPTNSELIAMIADRLRISLRTAS